MRLRFEPLGDQHNRAAFSCGHKSVDEFLKRIARQRQNRRIGTTIAAVDIEGDPRLIVGYFTLLPHEFRGEELPDPYREASRIGKLHVVPGALLAQLGVDQKFQGQGVGKHLMRNVFERVAVLANEWGCAALVTDPIDTRARTLYQGFDFIKMEGHPSRMILGTATIVAALKRTEAQKS